MTRKSRQNRLRRAGQFVLDALSGRVGAFMMTLSYAMVAVVLLAYVSTQVYTNSLREDISQRKRDQREAKEHISRLMADYASLSSRARISSYCEKRLGMVEAVPSQVTRVSIEGDVGSGRHAVEFTEKSVRIPDVLGADIGALTKVMER